MSGIIIVDIKNNFLIANTHLLFLINNHNRHTTIMFLHDESYNIGRTEHHNVDNDVFYNDY